MSSPNDNQVEQEPDNEDELIDEQGDEDDQDDDDDTLSYTSITVSSFPILATCNIQSQL